VLRAGCDAGIVLEPDARAVERLDEAQTWSGKPRRVVYRADAAPPQ
jgi:hypothetical protein